MKAHPWLDERLRLASIEITRRCDNDCAYCEQPKEARDLPLTQCTELLDELAAEGFQAVALGGGEQFCALSKGQIPCLFG
ncbi:MAG: radical SAM protein, partial [Anaerolineae bacterium]|nr:radical SAM protein [Anaerolineae bacterium]